MRLSRLLKTWRVEGGHIVAECFGALLAETDLIASRRIRAAGAIALTYGPTITVDAALGNHFQVNVTDNAAFAFGATLNPVTGQQIVITIRNISGGAHGTGSWQNVANGYLVAGNVPAIANGQQRSFGFVFTGTRWVECWRTAADIPNA